MMPLSLPPPSGKTSDVVAFGENSLDIVVSLPGTVPSDGKTAVDAVELRPGGQAATLAVGAARQGWRATCCGAIGDDEWSERIIDALEREAVEPRLVRRAGAATRTAVVLVESATGRRSILEHRDARLDLRPEEVPTALVLGTRILAVDATDVRTARALVATARQVGVPTMLDVDRAAPDVESLMKEVDILVVGAPFLAEVSGAGQPGEGLNILMERFRPSMAVVTLGAEGSLARVGSDEIRTRAPSVAVLDTTGAGDAFRAGLVGGWLRADPGADPRAVLRFANVTAALKCRSLGAQAGLPSRAEIEAAL